MGTLLWVIGILICVFVIVKILVENDLMEIVIGVVVIIVVGYYSIKKIKRNYMNQTHNAVMFHSVSSKSNNEKTDVSDIDNNNDDPQPGGDVPINPMPQPTVDPIPQPPTGHWEETQEQCDNCAGRGYNIRYIWVGGGHDNKEVEQMCSMCHGKGFRTKREYVMDY